MSIMRTSTPSLPGGVFNASGSMDSAPSSSPGATPSALRIESGDTLCGIARQYGTSVDALMRANPQIHDRNLIYAGATLNLPAGASAQASAGASSFFAAEAAGSADAAGTAATTTTASSPDIDAGTGSGISEADYEAVAKRLGVSVAKIKAVASVESGGSGMLKPGQCKILYEPYSFHLETHGAHDLSHPNVSIPHYDKYAYGNGGQHQWDKWEEAKALDPEAAMKSTSYGRFQIMGDNYQACGYKDVQSYVAAMNKGEGEQLNAFANFIQANPEMHAALQKSDWTKFARAYNGPGQADDPGGAYDVRIANAAQRFATTE
jgi:LysM repeat protein